MPSEPAPLETALTRALGSLGAGPASVAIDPILDPGGACAALAAEASLLLRLHPELGAPALAGYGPTPVEPCWVTLTGGSADVTVAQQRGAEDQAARHLRAEGVDLEQRTEPCCLASSCKASRTHASAWLRLSEGPRLLLAEARSLDAGAVGRVSAIASAFAKWLGLPLEATGSAPEGGEIPSPLAGSFTAGDLARYSMRSEGARVVLRDHASGGPRDTVASKRVIALIAGAIAIALWVEVVLSARIDPFGGRTLGVAAVAALLSLTAYAFYGVARFSKLYAAPSAPIVALGADRIIVLPWVGRDGAVDERPEGRLGAAIKLGELHDLIVKPVEERFTVEATTDHGPIDTISTPSQPLASLYAAALQARAAESAHPSKGASAKQRLRAKYAAS